MKIAFVLNRFYPEVGGAETNLFFQAMELAKHHNLSIFTPRRLPDSKVYEEIYGFRVWRLRDWWHWRCRYPNISRDTLMPGIFLRILFGNFDLVQLFPALNHNNILAWLAAKLRRIPVVLCSFDLLDYAELQKQSGKIDRNCLQDYQPSFWRRRLYGACDHIFAISNREIEVFRRYNSRVSFSPVPVFLEEFKQLPDKEILSKFAFQKTDFLFLVLGRISIIKGQDLAVKAFLRSAARLPGCKLLLVGRSDYEPEFTEALRQEVRLHQAEDRVLFLGLLARSEVIALLQASNIMIAPVRFMNSGAVIVEAWAAGTPVIQSDAVDPNLVVAAENGFLFQSENIDALGATMVQAYEQRQLLPQMGQMGQALVKKRFTYPHLIKIYQSVYQQLCPSK